MIKIAFAGFRHAHIFALYRKVAENPDTQPGGSWKQTKKPVARPRPSSARRIIMHRMISCSPIRRSMP